MGRLPVETCTSSQSWFSQWRYSLCSAGITAFRWSWNSRGFGRGRDQESLKEGCFKTTCFSSERVAKYEKLPRLSGDNLAASTDTLRSQLFLKLGRLGCWSNGTAKDIIVILVLRLTMSAPNCPCPKKDCVYHSNCEECVRHHKEKDEWPHCARWSTSQYNSKWHVCLKNV